jgi:hypothetical protein
VDFDFQVANVGLRELDIGTLYGAFGDEMAGLIGGMFTGVKRRCGRIWTCRFSFECGSYSLHPTGLGDRMCAKWA